MVTSRGRHLALAAGGQRHRRRPHVAGGGAPAAGRGGGMMSHMTPDYTDPPTGDDLDRSVSGVLRIRRVVIGVLVTVFLALPAVALFRKQGLSGDAVFLVPGTVVFIVLVGVALFVVGQMNWLTALAIAAAGAGRFAANLPRAVIGVAACAAVGAA